MAEQEPLKHIDTANLPTNELKAAWDLILAKQFSDLALYANIAYVVGWAILWLKSRRDAGPIFGETLEEAEFCELCCQIVDWCEDSVPRAAGSAIGAWLVKAMLLALLQKVIREIATNGDLPDWLLELIEMLKEQIEAL